MTSQTKNYTERAKEIRKLLDYIQMEVEHHEIRQTEEPGNWGMNGDLDNLKTNLLNALEAISGFDRKDIEEILSD